MKQTPVHSLRLAAESGRTRRLACVLDRTVALVTDTGGMTAAESSTVHGRRDVARRMHDLLDCDRTDITEAQVNGQSALVLRRDGRVTGIVNVRAHDHLITDLWVVLNPDKLRHWN